jgi:hypothetical protein
VDDLRAAALLGAKLRPPDAVAIDRDGAEHCRRPDDEL